MASQISGADKTSTSKRAELASKARRDFDRASSMSARIALLMKSRSSRMPFRILQEMTLEPMQYLYIFRGYTDARNY